MVNSNKQDNPLIRHPHFEGIFGYYEEVTEYPKFANVPCAEVGTDVFFYPDPDVDKPHAEESFYDEDNENDSSVRLLHANLRKICSQCPMLTDCFTWAVKHEWYGFWGGTSMQERRNLRERDGISYVNPIQDNELDAIIRHLRDWNEGFKRQGELIRRSGDGFVEDLADDYVFDDEV